MRAAWPRAGEVELVDGLWELDHGTVEIRPVFPAPDRAAGGP